VFSVSGTHGAQAAPIRVLVVDDHELFRIGLRRLLEGEGCSVSDADTARAAARRSADPATDVVVVGANRPAGCDCEAIRSTREAAPSAVVLVLALVLDEAHILRAVRAGYVLKDAELPHIVAAIRDAASGHSPLSPPVARVVTEGLRHAGEPEPRP
jgi:DNA-binding NarL/FixJ family response regulator